MLLWRHTDRPVRRAVGDRPDLRKPSRRLSAHPAAIADQKKVFDPRRIAARVDNLVSDADTDSHPDPLWLVPEVPVLPVGAVHFVRDVGNRYWWWRWW